MKDKDNYFIITEKEMKQMLLNCISETTETIDQYRKMMSAIAGLTPSESVLDLEQQEFIINKTITEQMKKMQVEVE